MNIEQLKSGHYRARMMRKGKVYTITYDSKPTQKQAEADLYEMMSKEPDSLNHGLTFADASIKYIDMKRNILSPNTLREYSQTCNRLSEWFTKMQIDKITQIDINKIINELSADRSPKTVRNYHAFISAILGTFRPDMKIYTTLPQKRKSEPYIPSDDDVKRILSELKNTDFYICIILACYGMRRGEICALTLDDIEGDVIHINKSVAFDECRNKIIKSTKTTESERDIVIPTEIADLIRKKGYVYNGSITEINDRLSATEKKLGIPHFSLHKLRHYFASKMITITDPKTVQALGGWKTDAVMKTIYAHSMKDEQEKAKRIAAQMLGDSIF